MSIYVLDPSFAYSLIGQRDSNHNRAVKIFELITDEDRIVFPEITYLELICGVFDVRDIDNLVSIVSDGKLEVTNSKDIKFIKNLNYETRRKLKSADCQIMAITIRKNAKLLSFDKKLIRVLEDLSTLAK